MLPMERCIGGVHTLGPRRPRACGSADNGGRGLEWGPDLQAVPCTDNVGSNTLEGPGVVAKQGSYKT